MDAANVYAVMNIISFICTIPLLSSRNSRPCRRMGHCCRRTVSASVMNIRFQDCAFLHLQRIRFRLYVSRRCRHVVGLEHGQASHCCWFRRLSSRRSWSATLIGSGIAIFGTFAYSLAAKAAQVRQTRGEWGTQYDTMVCTSTLYEYRQSTCTRLVYNLI
jgi:hypothetical protein